MGQFYKGSKVVPELPEVFTISNNLAEVLPSTTLTEVEIFENYKKIPTIEKFEEILNIKIVNVERISKNILIKFENKKYILIHLGMTGRIRYSEVKEKFGWDKIRLTFKNREGEIFYINFTDTRKFGKFQIIDDFNINSGHEVFNLNEKQIEEIIYKISRKKTEIKNILLDQKTISGLGNIYCNDTLFDAKIHPARFGSSLSKDEIYRIIVSSKKILEKGIQQKGSSLKDKMYTDIYGNFGNYQNSFLVYNKKNCPKCTHELQKIYIKQRSSYFCPKCQII